MKRLLLAVGALASLLLCSNRANAQISVTGSLGSRTGTGVLTIESPLTFTITTTGSVQYLVFDDWVTSDGGRTAIGFAAGSNITYELNGTPGTKGLYALYDNFNLNSNAVTLNDGLLYLNGSISVTAGETFTIEAGSWDLTGNTGFNPQVVANSPFKGDVFLTNGIRQQVSNEISATASAVPEPSTYALIAGACLLGWAVLRRRQRVAA